MVNNRGKQLEDLILKNYLIIFNDKSSTYFQHASGIFTSIDLTLHFIFISPGELVPTLVEVGEGKLETISASMQHSSVCTS